MEFVLTANLTPNMTYGDLRKALEDALLVALYRPKDKPQLGENGSVCEYMVGGTRIGTWEVRETPNPVHDALRVLYDLVAKNGKDSEYAMLDDLKATYAPELDGGPKWPATLPDWTAD